MRDATPADAAAVGELLVQAFELTYARKLPEVVVSEERRAELRAVAKKRGVAKVWVAEPVAGGGIVGTVALWPPGAAGNEAWLEGAADLRHLAVVDAHRRSGVSEQLMDVAEAAARATGCKAVCLHVRRGVTGVARMYLGRGYRRAPEGDLDLLPEVFLEAFVRVL